MTRAKLLALIALGTVVVCGNVSCNFWRDKGDIAHTRPAGAWEEQTTVGTPSEAEQIGRLQDLVAQTIREAEAQAATRRTSVIYRRPYYFKEFDEYTDSAASAEIEMRETESRTAPVVADVTLDKVRYATRMHRRKDAADVDANFLRDTGTETITYQYRNGRWMRVGSLFVAEKTEEQINGEWVPVQESVERTIAAEEQAADSWWRRAWDRLTGQ
jgi:hypothetical protein